MNKLYTKMLNPNIDGQTALKLLAEQRGVSHAMTTLDSIIEGLIDRFETLSLYEEEE